MTPDPGDNSSQTNRLQLTAQIVSAYVGNNSVTPSQITEVIKSVYNSLARPEIRDEAVPKAKQKPAVPIEKSVTANYLVCLEDGQKLKMLKRHLRTFHGLRPEDYRAKWGLSPDYPMVAPNYAKRRSDFAKQFGLGKRRA